MLNGFLSSQVPALATPTSHVELARGWSHQSKLEADRNGLIFWSDKTRYSVSSSRWLGAPEPSIVSVQHALIPLGPLEDFFLVAFVTPLEGLVEAFKISAGLNTAARRGVTIPPLHIDLEAFVRDHRRRDHELTIHALFGRSANGSERFAVVDGKDDAPPEIQSLDAIEIVANRKTSKVNRDFSLLISDVEAQNDQVADTLTRTYRLFQPYVGFEAPAHRWGDNTQVDAIIALDNRRVAHGTQGVSAGRRASATRMLTSVERQKPCSGVPGVRSARVACIWTSSEKSWLRVR